MALFAVIRRVLTDPRRRLPDGRMLAELAPDRVQLDEYGEHVRIYCAM
jgi:hypothetical protein